MIGWVGEVEGGHGGRHGGQGGVRWSGFDRKIGAQPVDHTHPTFWSSYSRVILSYLYHHPIISLSWFHQQTPFLNKCSCFIGIDKTTHKFNFLAELPKIFSSVADLRIGMTSAFSINGSRNMICLWMDSKTCRGARTAFATTAVPAFLWHVLLLF